METDKPSTFHTSPINFGFGNLSLKEIDQQKTDIDMEKSTSTDLVPYNESCQSLVLLETDTNETPKKNKKTKKRTGRVMTTPDHIVRSFKRRMRAFEARNVRSRIVSPYFVEKPPAPKNTTKDDMVLIRGKIVPKLPFF